MTIENPLVKENWVNTPKDLDELQAIIKNISDYDITKANPYVTTIMAWNLASKMVDEAIAEAEGKQ